MVSRRPILTALLALTSFLTSGARALPAIVVRGETQMTAECVRADGRGVVRVRLADELGVPLVASRVEVTFGGAGLAARPPTMVLSTDAHGDALAELPAAYSATEALAAFSGGPFYSPAERTVICGASNPSVAIGLPHDGRMELSRPAHSLRLTAQGGWRGELEVFVLDELGRRLGRALLHDDHPTSVEIASGDLGEPGPGRVVVARSDDGSELARHTVIRVSDALVSLALREYDGRVYADGTVTVATSREGIPRAPVALILDGALARTITTDQEGNFSEAIDRESEARSGAQLSARFESNVEWYRSASSPSVRLSKHWPVMPAHVVATLCTVAVLVSLFASVRRERKGSTSSSALAVARSPRTRDLDAAAARLLRVVDARTNRPIPVVRLVTVDGVDAVVGDREGFLLVSEADLSKPTATIHAEGYEPREVSADLTRPGFSSIALTSYRDHAFSLLTRLAAYSAYSAKGQTPRELVRSLRCETAMVVEGRELALRIEVAMFGAVPPDATTTADIVAQFDRWVAKAAAGRDRPTTRREP